MEVRPRTQTVQPEARCSWGPSGVMAAAARGDRLSVRTQLLVWACAAGCEAPCWAHFSNLRVLGSAEHRSLHFRGWRFEPPPLVT